MFYQLGIEKASAAMRLPGSLRRKLLKILEHPTLGDYATKVPLRTAIGALGGYGLSRAAGSEHPGRHAAIAGAISGVTGGAMLASPKLKNTLIKMLKA
jgi:hypothetical protein